MTIANPPNTDRPTAAEWSGENVIMSAATAAMRARASCTERVVKGRPVDGRAVREAEAAGMTVLR
ncbi:hypothetical protein GCM10010455_16900 [Microbacterium esteraromaticum]